MQGTGWHSFPLNKNTFGLQASCLEIVIRMYSLELQIGGMKQYMSCRHYRSLGCVYTSGDAGHFQRWILE